MSSQRAAETSTSNDGDAAQAEDPEKGKPALTCVVPVGVMRQWAHDLGRVEQLQGEHMKPDDGGCKRLIATRCQIKGYVLAAEQEAQVNPAKSSWTL